MSRTTHCGFNDIIGCTGAQALTVHGPTLFVNIGFDPAHTLGATSPPIAGREGLMALVDTGAWESCIDSHLAAELKLPVVNRKFVSGSGGRHEVSVHLAQIYIPSLNHAIIGEFCAVDLAAGGQRHRALIGRTFLASFEMHYNGKTGSVTLTMD